MYLHSCAACVAVWKLGSLYACKAYWSGLELNPLSFWCWQHTLQSWFLWLFWNFWNVEWILLTTIDKQITQRDVGYSCMSFNKLPFHFFYARWWLENWEEFRSCKWMNDEYTNAHVHTYTHTHTHAHRHAHTHPALKKLLAGVKHWPNKKYPFIWISVF